MTLIIGMHLVEYVLVAADRRVCFYPNGTLEYADIYDKIAVPSWGLIAATGVNHLIDRVEELLVQSPPGVADDFLAVVNQAKEDIRSSPYYYQPGVPEGMEATSWFFVFRTPAMPPEQGHALRLVRLGAHTDWLPEALAPGAGSMNRPVGSSVETMRSMKTLAGERCCPKSSEDDLMQHLSHHIDLCCEVFKTVSVGCQTVSQTFHVGLMFPDGSRLLSNEIDAVSPGPVEFSPQ